ncbi:uncharacterized protein LOC141527827 isoform X2 [Cotesia typhae]|uniref:uncharacterized protein LOC141527827 isoform X2 n=1 Tax=Cotesia typhae TaxID=2053667 RepID=UPI003D68B1A4
MRHASFEVVDLMRRATAQSNNNQAGPSMNQENNMNDQRPAQSPAGDNDYSKEPVANPGNGYATSPSYPQGPAGYTAPYSWGGYPNYGYQPNPWGGYPNYGYQPAPNYNAPDNSQSEHSGFHQVQTKKIDDKIKDSHTLGLDVFGVHLGHGQLNHQITRKGQEVTTTYEHAW